MPCPSGPPSVPCWEHGLGASPPSRGWRHPGAGGRLFVWKVRPPGPAGCSHAPPHPAQVPCKDSEHAEPMDLETEVFLFLLQEK